MASTSDIYTLLRLYAKKQQRSVIPFDEFCAYLKKYAQHYVSEQPGLEIYTTSPQEPLLNTLNELHQANKILLKEENEEQVIIISAYFIENVSSRYKLMADKPEIPYPTPNDLPKDFPQELISTGEATDILYNLFDGKTHSMNMVFSLVFKREITPVILPEDVSAEFLMKAAIAKLRALMHHSEQHDYFQQKLMTSNGGREISVKNFFTMFVSNEEGTIEKIKAAGDAYYFWNQLLLFMRHDYEKIKDRTPEDTALLQSVCIIEICISYFKNRSQNTLQKETALRNLELAFSKLPYYYDATAISKFVDTRGIPLLGQYTEDDLNEYLHQQTTTSNDGRMPPMLTFKTSDGNRYFVLHEKVFPLTIKLCNDIRKNVHDDITNEWYAALHNFKTVPAMKDMQAFNRSIEEAIQKESPVLYAILTSSFLSSIYYEALNAKDSNAEKFKIFNDGILVPYNELLMLSQHTIMTDAKIMLPVWYTMPILSFIISLLFGKKSPKAKKDSVPKKTKKAEKQKKQKDSSSTTSTISIYEDAKPAKSSSGTGTKKDEFKKAVATIEKEIVPPDSSLDSELTSYLNEWNHLLDKDAKKNLTEDVNSLIRDYLRKILRTTNPTGFTLERVRELSATLVKTPALQKIHDTENLQIYIQLYILRLVKKA